MRPGHPPTIGAEPGAPAPSPPRPRAPSPSGRACASVRNAGNAGSAGSAGNRATGQPGSRAAGQLGLLEVRMALSPARSARTFGTERSDGS